ncbi:MAG: tyrosine-type recombinase/integrase [Pseudomonadota bacterium]
MKNLCKRAGVKHFGLHAIRHMTASILAKEGVPMIDIQTILRHKNLSTTERYIRRIEAIRPAFKYCPD